MPDGILLTSGTASGIGAASTNFNSGYLATPGFPELDAIATATTYDGCMLEFDIIPTCDTINLKYVMGSEEYPEYVGSGFNDAFAFYLNGPKPGGGTYNNENIGTIPGTTTPITINNVNQNQNTQWYVDNTSGGTIVYDGFTQVLTAALVVVPCQTYHMKIMIADGGDSGFDSGIFLSAKGLTCPNTITLSPDQTICGGESVPLQATGAAIYSWTPATGLNTTTGPDVFATPSVTTTYTVSYDGGPCAQQLYQTVTVTVNGANVNVSDTSLCLGESVQYNIVGNGVFTWDPPIGLSATNIANPIISPTVTTLYIVTVVQNQCTDSDTLLVTVDPLPQALFFASTECHQTATIFNDQSTVTPGSITSWQWNLGDSTTDNTNTPPSHIYATTGTYNVQLNVTSDQGCNDSIIVPVMVKPKPTPSILTTTVCFGEPTVFGNTAANMNETYQWNFGDSGYGSSSTAISPTHTYSTHGDFQVTLTTTQNGCDSTVYALATVNPKPLADFTATTECFGVATQITDNSTVATGNITNWNWNLGNGYGSSTNGQFPAPYVYNAAGTYNVQLIVTTDNNCADTNVISVTVKPQPIASYVVDSVCDGNAITFTDNSFIPTGSSYLLNTGDYNSSSSPNFTHTYVTQGTYQSDLTISLDGCIGTYSIPVSIFPKPIAAFGWNDVCFGNAMNLIDQTQSSIPLQSWKWSIGPIAFSTLQNPVHYFPFPADYNVTLIATNVKGCSDTTTNKVSVYHLPQAAFTFKNVCADEAVNFTDISSVAIGNITQWEWIFGEQMSMNDVSNQTNTSWLYSGPGTYNPRLIVTTATGCTDTLSQTVVVNPMPEPLFTHDNVCFGSFNTFTNTSTTTASQWNWNFGDNTTPSNNQNEFHVYSQPGSYLVTLTETSDSGCVSISQQHADVYNLPQAGFAGSNVCVGNNTEFSNITVVAAGDNAGWSWDFGDLSGTSPAQNPYYLYATEGTYTVVLTATTNHNCVDTAVRVLEVYSLPTVAFTADDTAGCAEHCVNFKDASTVAGANVVISQWNYGDGSPAQNSTKPYHCYTTPGEYDVVLTVTSDQGCSASSVYRSMITVHPNPMANFTFDPEDATILDPVITFTNTSILNEENAWTFGDGTNSIAINPIHTFKNEENAIYPVKLVVTSEFGCTDSIVKSVKIGPEYAFYVPNVFTPNGDGDNDFFFGIGLGVVSEEVYVYNRWGNLIFKSNETDAQWDGKIQNGASGQLAGIDVYVYRFVVKDLTGKRHNITGHVSLLR